MKSSQARHILKTMTPGQIAHLSERLELMGFVAMVEGKKPDLSLLHFVQSEISGEHPKLLEKRNMRPRNTKLRIREE